MRAIFAALILIAASATCAQAQFSGDMNVPDPVTAGFTATRPSGTSTFAGVADSTGVGGGGVSNWTMWGSCARAYSNAKAAAHASVCDVVDTATGLVTCTFHLLSSGFVNPTECNSTACSSACRLTKLYDQSGNGNDMVESTLGQMPDMDFSPGIGNGPAFSCVGRGAGNCRISTVNTFSPAEPYNFYSVYKSAQSTGGLMGVNNSNTIWAGVNGGAANQATINNTVFVAATNANWHAFNTLMLDPANSALNIDGSDTVVGNASVATMSGAQLRCHRADGGATQDVANMLECGFIVDGTTALTATNRNNISSNAHSATNGYNF